MNLSVAAVRRYLTLSFFVLLFLSIYGSVSAQEMDPGCEQLFFSEYGEDSGYPSDKYVEIYNPGDQDVDLSNYRLWKISNGGNWYEVQMAFTGSTLAAGDTYVLAPDISNFDENVPNVDQWSGNINVSGDDAIGLAFNGGSGTTFFLIDVIGDEGPDIGDGWDVAGVTAATKDHTLIRKASVQGPNADWQSSAGTDATNSEWIVSDFDLSDVGSHSMESCGEEEVYLAE
jgi:predicted extracellular nuclease